jgi:hypothetical protein
MANDTHRIIWCLLKGDSIAFPIFAPADAVIDELKKLIKAENENELLNGIDAKNLKLWKVSGFSQLWLVHAHPQQPREPIPIKPSRTLSERLSLRGSSFSDFADELEVADKVSVTFPGHLSEEQLHIIAEHVRTGEWSLFHVHMDNADIIFLKNSCISSLNMYEPVSGACSTYIWTMLTLPSPSYHL